MRIVLADSAENGEWPRAANRFAGLDDVLRALGHDVRLVSIQGRTPGPTIVAGAERERDVAPVIASTRLLAALGDPADLVICPLRGGLAHGLLMARACGEIATPPSVALWCDGLSRDRVVNGDFGADQAVRLLVADAMERICLEQADHLLAPDATILESLPSLGVRTPPVSHVAPWRPEPANKTVGGEAVSLAFIGPLAQRTGLFAFVEAAERLASDSRLAIRELCFIARDNDPETREGARWLDLRLRRASVPHRVIEIASDTEAARLVAQQGWLSLACCADVAQLPGWFVERERTIAVSLPPDSRKWRARIEAALAGDPAQTTADDVGWAAALEAIGEPPPVASTVAMPSVSVCMLHFDRPRLLEAALASFAGALGERDETIVVDNASARSDSHALIDRLESDGRATIVRNPRGQPLPEAYNHAIRAARGDYVVFLDDDNMFTPGGLARLRKACASGAFDVVVSNLQMFDDEGGATVDGPQLSFIGQARSAGLFFNAFGDTCMAFRRDALQALGGYLELGVPYPSPDWLLLARAQAAGLKIGVLQQPAYRYRRRASDAAPVWQKFDRRTPRRLVMQHYGEAFDAAMLARFAQSAMLEL